MSKGLRKDLRHVVILLRRLADSEVDGYGFDEDLWAELKAAFRLYDQREQLNRAKRLETTG